MNHGCSEGQVFPTMSRNVYLVFIKRYIYNMYSCGPKPSIASPVSVYPVIASSYPPWHFSFIFDFNRLDPSVYSGITNWPTIMQHKNPEGWGVLPIVAYTRRVGILLVKVYKKEGLNGV